MSSERNTATSESTSEVEGEATHSQGRVNWPGSSMNASVESTPQAINAGVSVHDHDIFLEQRGTGDDPIHALPQEDARPNSKISSSLPGDLPLPEVSDPLIPKPDGDPFEYFLKPMLEKDNVQCNAWKDEVQNILIFAGLFSAVVTAFIIESYQRLQPDPNDTIVGLLAHIAEKLDTPSINGTASISSIVSDTNFVPSRANININIFWFISLVLSLTAALIGIITLQWLREHQRYDNALKPRERLAMLNMRLISLKTWYVPQIFAGLPLLLQGALVLFFAGMIEFLFALRLEVAIPVTLSICIPLIFLIATTVLPILQVCILQDPFRLSINNQAPSPCPYKSPQSLIARRFSTASQTTFKYFASMVAGAYLCVVKIKCAILKLQGCDLPIFHSGPHFGLMLCEKSPQQICQMRDAFGDWPSIDMAWLHVRITHIALYRLAIWGIEQSITESYGRNYIYATLPQDVYDSVCCFDKINYGSQTKEDDNAYYHCAEALCSEALRCQAIYVARMSDSRRMLHFTSFSDIFGLLLCRQTMHPGFIKDVMRHESKDKSLETLRVAFLALWKVPSDDLYVSQTGKEAVRRLLVNRLKLSPARLFAMSESDMWPSFQISEFLRIFYDEKDSSQLPITHSCLVFLKACSIIQPDSLAFHPSPTAEAYGGISAYMQAVAYNQSRKDVANTLAHVTQLCDLNATPHLMQEKPFLLIAACFYLDAVIKRGRGEWEGKISVFLLKLILEASGIQDDRCTTYYGWNRLHAVIDAIYNHHNPSQTT